MIDKKQNAFMEAYSPCHEAFTKYCAALCYGRMNAEDLIQDILLSAYEHFDKVQNKDQLLHYLIRAARNKSISQWRRSKYKEEFIDQHAHELKARGIPVETQLDIQYLYKVLDYLPEKQKDAVILYEISGFSMREIAEIQNSNEAAIKNLVSRGRRKLRDLMNQKPKSRWAAFLLFLKPIQEISPSKEVNLENLFSYLKELAFPRNAVQTWTNTYQGTTSSGLAFQYWMYQINLNHIIMSSISLASIVTIGVFVFMPNPSTEKITPQKADSMKPIVEEPQNKEMSPNVAQLFSLPKFENKFEDDLNEPSHLSLPEIEQVDSKQILSPVTFHNNQHLDLSGNSLLNPCDTKLVVEGSVKQLKSTLKKKLYQDKLINDPKEKMRMTFLDDKVQVNGRSLNSKAMSKYLSIIGQYNIKPCPDRLIEITTDYIAIGKMTDEGFDGRVNGRVDLNDLNFIKLKNTTKRVNFSTKVEERPIKPFSTLEVSGLAVVHLSRGETKTARVEVTGMPIKDLITKVEGGKLIITTKGEHNGESIKVNISAPTLEGIEVKGAAELYSTDTIIGDALGIIVSEAGSAKLDINTTSVNIMLSGGDLEVSGKTGEQNVMRSGDYSRGTFDASKLEMVED